MDNYTLMRLSENQDEDALDFDDLPESPTDLENGENFKRKYKEFYTDIKINIKEDW